jgi:hypothetical protein
MVGIHALSIGQILFLRSGLNDLEGRSLSQPPGAETKANRNGARSSPDWGRGASMQRTTCPTGKRSCAHQFAIVSAFGSVFERLGCPHKVADTRLALTTDR